MLAACVSESGNNSRIGSFLGGRHGECGDGVPAGGNEGPGQTLQVQRVMGSPQSVGRPAIGSVPLPELGTPMRRSGWRISGLRVRFVMVVVAVCGALWLSALFDTLRDRAVALDTAERQHDNIAGALAEQAARSLQATDLILQQAALLDPPGPGA